ncbi:MAG: septum formation initiator family protein [Bacteroidales bacterium]|nr:septum formation initiator family protein [Bacteroidales bacterium]
MKQRILKSLKFLGNKYVIATIIFLLLILFLDDYNLMDTRRLRRQVKELRAEERELRNDMVEDSVRAASLRGNLDAIERYGRENYYMKRSDEDIYVIKDRKK